MSDKTRSGEAAGATTTAINPRTGQLLHPPPTPPLDPKVLAPQARAQANRQKAQAEAIHQQVKVQAEIELARMKTELDAKMALLNAHLKAAIETLKMQRAHARHEINFAGAELGMAAAAANHDAKVRQTNTAKGNPDV